MTDGFGARMREERERRGIDLSTIAAATKISVALFEQLERDDVSRWPQGIFRRSFVRAYAKAIGLDPETTLREFLDQFPDPAEVAAAAARGDSDNGDTTPRPRRHQAVLRLTFADVPAPYGGGRLLEDLAKRCAAVVLDGIVVTGLALGLFLVLGKFWMPFGILTLGYYIAATLFLGNTPGVWLLAPRDRRIRRRGQGANRPRTTIFEPAATTLELIPE